MATVLRLPGLPGLWPRASIPEFPGGWLVGWLVGGSPVLCAGGLGI